MVWNQKPHPLTCVKEKHKKTSSTEIVHVFKTKNKKERPLTPVCIPNMSVLGSWTNLVTWKLLFPIHRFGFNSFLTPIGQMHILGKNCKKMPLFKAVRKTWKKSFFFKTQLYKYVLDYYGNVWKKFKNFDHMDWKIITFEVKRKSSFWPCLTRLVAFNSSWSEIFTLYMVIIFDICNLYHVNSIHVKFQKKKKSFAKVFRNCPSC